jgi:hypothetical protein
METRTVLQSFKALYGAFEQFTKEGKHLCQVDTNTQRSPGWEKGSVTFSCGESNGSLRRLVVSTRETFSREYKGTPTTELVLTLGQPPPARFACARCEEGQGACKECANGQHHPRRQDEPHLALASRRSLAPRPARTFPRARFR